MNSVLTFLKSTVFISFITTIVVIFTSVFVLMQLNRQHWVEEDYQVECFEKLEAKIHESKDTIILTEIIDCFEWDSVCFKTGMSFNKHLDLNYKIVRFLSDGKIRPFNFEEDYGLWRYVYFYKHGDLLPDAIAIPSGSVVNRMRKNRQIKDDIQHTDSIQTYVGGNPELAASAENNSISNYFNDVYKEEHLIIADDNMMLSIVDSLDTKDTSRALFYFIVFTKSMNGSDGFYSEALGMSAMGFFVNKTEKFADYFSRTDKLNEQDLDHWAWCIYGEIQISREGEEQKAILELETTVLKKMRGKRKENILMVETVVEKLKTAHQRSTSNSH